MQNINSLVFDFLSIIMYASGEHGILEYSSPLVLGLPLSTSPTKAKPENFTFHSVCYFLVLLGSR